MSDDVTQIRTLIERWAKAVHIGDIEGVLADHAADIVMSTFRRLRRAYGASTPTARPGPASSSGKERVRSLRSFRSTSP